MADSLNDPNNASQAYADLYGHQLGELLTNYGPIWEIWWDGTLPGGALPAATFNRWADTIHKLQPQCVIWGDCDAATTPTTGGKAAPLTSVISAAKLRGERLHRVGRR